MKFLRLSAVFHLLLSAAALAQEPATAGQTVLVAPFENQSKAPGIEWVGDAFPELLQDRLNSATLFVLPREDRLRAYDRVGIPVELHPSRATLYRIAEQLDVDYVVLGLYRFDGRTFTTSAQLLDMRRQRLLPEMNESGPLIQLIDIQTALAWDVLHTLRPEISISQQAYVDAAPSIRLDAFENYIRGVTAPTTEEQIQHFREAVRRNPAYPEALLQLGKAYYRGRQYELAVSSLTRVPENNPLAREANFYLGLAAYDNGDFPRAESAFRFVAARLPLAEVYNNLGVVSSRADRKTAAEYFQKAIDADPNDPDYHFNLAIELYRTGDLAGASRQLRDTLSLKPGDTAAKSLLDAITPEAKSPAPRAIVPVSQKTPLERIRANYDESSFRQLALKIEAVAEQRLAKTDPLTHAKFHTDRGHQLLTQAFISEAEAEFREAIALNSSNPEAHAGLASVLEAENNPTGARSEAEEALRLRQFPEPLLVLARLDLRDNRAEAAAENIAQALRLEPSNASALALKRAVAAKLAQEAQPLPNR
ncbi:MAG TPA: tetratricopeptide repeat protein [Terriglobales bacterium]|nr:tetratricopeptide repeat protein [Terriglobales bacterium]